MKLFKFSQRNLSNLLRKIYLALFMKQKKNRINLLKMLKIGKIDDLAIRFLHLLIKKSDAQDEFGHPI